MEENVALDSKKQKQFVKSLKGIKKRIVKNKAKTNGEASDVIAKPAAPEKKEKKRRRDRGLVYLAHIPHGFYEHEMTQYFKQFGGVSNARVIRSKRTGNSKGYAFVEFHDTAVAQIVAETMNNYLMGKRLIKAVYIPPEKQRRKAFRKRWNNINNPTSVMRLKKKKAYNAPRDKAGDLKRSRKLLANFYKTKKKLSEYGISYDFFTPVDIPQELLPLKTEVKKEEKVKEDEAVKKEEEVSSKKKDKKTKAADKAKKEVVKTETVKAEVKPKPNEKVKKEKVKVEVNKKEQKQKQTNLKQSGVKPPEDFIKTQESDDSDSSVDFDSDEYEKILEDDDSGLSDEDETDEQEESEDSESEVELPPKKAKTKAPPKVLAPPAMKKVQIPAINKTSPTPKRKAPQKAPVPQKKPKFEKQSIQKTVKKQFKKK